MKRILTTIVTFLSLNASAGFVGDYYSSEKMRFENRCGIPICRANDNGRGFVGYCNFQRSSIIRRSEQPVYVWHGDSGSKCYCPCDYAFENEVSPSH